MKTYFYKGQRVFLAYENDMPDAKPITSVGNVGCYPVSAYNGCATCITNDEVYTGEIDDESEIVPASCMNFEYEQALAEGWYTKYYAEFDEFERMLCVETTRYHRWTSELTRAINRLVDHEDNHTVVYKWFADSEREDWQNTVNEYRRKISSDNPLDFPDAPSFDAILEMAGVKVEDDNNEE